MKTVQDRLRFIVDFVNKDLASLREGDWLNLKEDFYAFLYPSGVSLDVYGGLLAMAEPRPEKCENVVFVDLQKDVHELLKATVREKSTYRNVEVTVRLSILPLGANSVAHAMGKFRDTALLSLWALLLVDTSPWPLMRCAAPDCGKIFYRIRKQKFCSDSCANRTYMKKYRESGDVRDTESEAAHSRYAKKQKKKYGENTKVKRVKKGGKLNV